MNERLIQAIPKGKENAKHLQDLARELNRSTDTVKHMIRSARKEGVYILSDQTGYWISDNVTEIRAFIGAMTRQSTSRFASIKEFKAQLGTIDGQMSLEDYTSE